MDETGRFRRKVVTTCSPLDSSHSQSTRRFDHPALDRITPPMVCLALDWKCNNGYRMDDNDLLMNQRKKLQQNESGVKYNTTQTWQERRSEREGVYLFKSTDSVEEYN